VTIDSGTIDIALDHACRRLEQRRFAAALWTRRLRAFAESIRTSGVSDIILLGMGGSSLAPEVLRAVIGIAPGFPRFQVLDAVDPDAVRAAMARPATSLFVLASKSGATIEPNSMAAEAERRIRRSKASG